jgi:ABC-type bacteriocin/lantibiotic exporter with double-glycine peptidase domain
MIITTWYAVYVHMYVCYVNFLLIPTYQLCLVAVVSVVLICVILLHWDEVSSKHVWKGSEKK